MDKEALRKQIYEELQTQFDGRLREAKKQKSELEEELETSTEKWRSERRRLNSEIDRLEAALADSRDARRKAPDTKPAKPSETVDASKLQAAADERLKKATKDWDTERARLEKEVSRLQAGVAELLERANNPLRDGAAVREQLQLRVDEAMQAKRQAEDSLLAAKAEWDQEKLRLAGELIKARRSAGLKTPKGELPEDEETRKLKTQLEEARAKLAALEAQVSAVRDAAAREYAAQIERERKDTGAIREKLEKEIEQVKGKAAADREQIAQLQEAHTKITSLEAQVAVIRDAAAKEYADQIERERKDTGAAREKLEKEIERLKAAKQAEFERQNDQVEESRRAHARIRELEHRLTESKSAAAASNQTQQLETQLSEAIAAKKAVEADLLTRTEELRRATARLSEAQAEAQQLERRLDETKDLVSTEAVAQLRRQYDERLQEMIRQKTQLSEQLNSASSLLEAERSRFAEVAASSKNKKTEGRAPNTIDSETISAEVARVEAMIADIVQLIDDPSTELSIVIRKNVERAELDAYLKGILFSLGKNRGL